MYLRGKRLKMQTHKSTLLSKEIRQAIETAKTKQEEKITGKPKFQFLSDNAWHVVRCGGGVAGQGCGRRFSLAQAKFRAEYLVCPHCGMEN